MAIRDLVHRCPQCGTPGGLRGRGDLAVCSGCGARLRRVRGARIELAAPGTPARVLDPSFVLDLVDRLGGVEGDPAGTPVSTEVVFSRLERMSAIRQGRVLLGWVERSGRRRRGTLEVTRTELIFRPALDADAKLYDAGEDRSGGGSDSVDGGADESDPGEQRWPLRRVQGLQVASKALQVAVANSSQVMNFELLKGSPLRWERLLQTRIQQTRAATPILEFQPRVVDERDALAALARPPRGPAAVARGPLLERVRRARAPLLPLYPVVRAAALLLRPFVAPVRVTGAEHIPARGPCILVVNHQSLLDPVFVQAACRRRVRSMTKSTAFRKPGMARLLAALGGFPVRRFMPDPQAVRSALRVLAQGDVLGIYPEGERSWDTRLQPFRRGTLRFLMASGVPVVPVAILGSYDVLPRWSRRLRRAPVDIRFGQPIAFPELTTRPEREAAVAWADAVLREAFLELGVPAPAQQGGGMGQGTMR